MQETLMRYKVRIGTRIKDTLSDENIELLRDNCEEIESASIGKILYFSL